MESPTGYKESHDLGYTLRTRYPDLYNDGQYFPVWANNYTRVLQTAQMFVRGYLGPFAPLNGDVVSVTSTGFPGAVGDSLSPSDICPKFADTQGAAQQAEWAAVFLPPIKQRLQALIAGNLTLTDADVLQIPYLCGFESQITGRLSPWCGVFTDDELKSYEYYNDLRYYYGIGPGTGLPSTMMMPFVNALVGGLLAHGPANLTGTFANGTAFALPKLIMAFMNDGQIAEIANAIGVFDDQAPLAPAVRDDARLYMASRFVTMRGTIAFERLNCLVAEDDPSSTSSTLSTTTQTSTTTSPPPRITTIIHTSPTTICPTLLPRTTTSTTPKLLKNETFLRLRLNDAVYPLPACQSGPGRSCRMAEYVAYLAGKYAAQGSWAENCNVTVEGAEAVVKGASFFGDLRVGWVRRLGA